METKVKNRKKIGIIVGVLIFLTAIAVSVYFFYTKENVQIPILNVSSNTMQTGEIVLESSFKILSDIETTQEYIQKTINVEPNIEYEIKEINEFEYEILPKEKLDSNTIYNVVYQTEQSKYKWSFQTEKIYNVTNVYPKNEATNVDTNTVIELTFSYIPNNDIEQYVTITPTVEGKFEYDERKVRFIPKEELKPNTKYEIKVNKGLTNSENEEVLNEDITTTFYTAYRVYQTSTLSIDNIFTFTSKSDIEIFFTYPSYSRQLCDIKVQVYRYNNENEFALAVMNQQKSISDNALVEVSTRGLKKVLDVRYESKDIEDSIYGYGKVLKLNSILDTGYYLATIQENDITYYVNIQINDIMGYVSYYDDEALVWINSAKTNQSVSDALVYRDGEVIGNTNENGYLRLNNFQRDEGSYNSEYIKIEKENELPLYIFFFDWYYKDNDYYIDDQNLNVYSFLDRNKYKSGEQVYFWGFIKNKNGQMYNNVSLQLCHLDYSTVLETKNVSVDEYGAFTTTFDLSGYDDGHYYIQVHSNGKIVGYQYFEIREYITKNYNVEAKINKDVVFSGEELQLDLFVTLFDGTPIQDTEFKYSYFYDDNQKMGTAKTDANGVATVMLDTKYTTKYSQPIYTSVQIWNDGVEAESEIQYIPFVVLPKQESYFLECTYDKENDKYIFEATTYLYDKNKENYIGSLTSREIDIEVKQYQNVKVLDYVRYNEDTKTNEEVYKIEKNLIGTEMLKMSTENGKGVLEYFNPILPEVDGYITYTSTMKMENEQNITNTNYTYIDGLEQYISQEKYTVAYQYDKTYKVGDDIVLKILENEKEVTNDIKVLHILKSVKGVEVIVTQNPEYTFKFTSDYGTDIIVKTYVFDGTAIYNANMYEEYITFSLDKSELQLDIDIAFDKAVYKPGEEATITVSTKHKGQAIQASVNICAIDQSYLAYYEKYTDIINSLYSYYYFRNSNDVVSHKIGPALGGGGGGGDGEPRDNFVTTAFFQNVITDENGKATLKIKWPDNVTSWGVFAQGISKEYKAGQKLENVNVTLPFFVTPIYEETYLVNEEPNINIRANGVNVKNGDEVIYNVILTLPDQSQSEQTIYSTVGQYATYQLPNLLPGTYKFKIYGKCNDYSDTVIYEFDVQESNLSTVAVNDYTLKKDSQINNYATVTRMYLYNTSTEKIVKPLLELTNLPNIRNDQIVISKLASEILEDLTQGKYTNNIEAKFFDEEGIEIIENAQKDVVLTTKILSTGYSYVYKEVMVNFFEEYIQNKDIDVKQKLIAYWGLATLKQPVLLQLYELDNQIDKQDIYSRAILGLAYADIGEYTKGNKILKEILPLITTSNKEVYEYVTMLAIKLNNEQASQIYNNYLMLDRESEYTNFVKLMYVQNHILNNVEKARVILNINGEDVQYDLKDIGITVLDIKSSDVVTVKSVDKNAKAKLEQYRTIDKTIDNGVLKKEYIVNGKTTNTFSVGDIVTTRIYIDYEKLNGDIKYFEVQDVLPNCMVYLKNNEYYQNDKNIVKEPFDINGNKLSFVVFRLNGITPYIEYTARVISAGKYVSDGTVIKTYDNVIQDYISAGNIEVK